MIIRKILNKFNLDIGWRYPRAWLIHGLKNYKDLKNLKGVEIGVFEGEHAVSILKNLNIDTLYLVDPYLSYEDYDTKEIINASNKAINNLKKFENFEWINEKSENAVKSIPDNLDFVYIDGSHTFESVSKDIEIYYKKLKRGGILAGHDFINGNCEDHDGVLRAVISFVTINNLDLYVQFGDWWVYKE